MKRLAAICCLAVLLATPIAEAAPVTFQLSASTLNGIAQAVGSLSGDAGKYEIYAQAPCFPDFWNQCRITLYSADLYWMLSQPQFQITPAGVTFTGKLTATYAGLQYSSNVAGTVAISFQSSSPAFALSISNIAVPIQFQFPLLGSITLTTIAVNPQYGFTVPVGAAQFSQSSTSGASTIYAQLSSAALNYQYGYVVVSAEFTIW